MPVLFGSGSFCEWVKAHKAEAIFGLAGIFGALFAVFAYMVPRQTEPPEVVVSLVEPVEEIDSIELVELEWDLAPVEVPMDYEAARRDAVIDKDRAAMEFIESEPDGTVFSAPTLPLLATLRNLTGRDAIVVGIDINIAATYWLKDCGVRGIGGGTYYPSHLFDVRIADEPGAYSYTENYRIEPNSSDQLAITMGPESRYDRGPGFNMFMAAGNMELELPHSGTVVSPPFLFVNTLPFGDTEAMFESLVEYWYSGDLATLSKGDLVRVNECASDNVAALNSAIDLLSQRSDEPVMHPTVSDLRAVWERFVEETR